mgnify:CR=1 FL=1
MFTYEGLIFLETSTCQCSKACSLLYILIDHRQPKTTTILSLLNILQRLAKDYYREKYYGFTLKYSSTRRFDFVKIIVY